MYNNRYYADFVYRLSGSSKFGSNHGYGQFWCWGRCGTWHNENFLKFEKLNLLKIRGSVGYTGKVNFEPFQSITMYKYENTLEYLHGIGAIPQTIGNDDLKWEREFSYNIGADISLFDRRLNATLDFYLKRTKDLVLDASIAPSTGVVSGKQNIGEMENKGFEFSVDGFIIQRNDVWWQLGMNGSTNKNRILKISNALKRQNELNNDVAPTRQTPAPLAQYEEGEFDSARKSCGRQVSTRLPDARCSSNWTVPALSPTRRTIKWLCGDTDPVFTAMSIPMFSIRFQSLYYGLFQMRRLSL